MNHRAKSVVRHMVEGDKSRSSYSFSQPLYGIEFLLQGWTGITQEMETTAGISKRGSRISSATAINK